MHHRAPFSRRQLLAAAAAAGLLPQSLWAQSGGYPSRHIELIVPAGAGGGTDVLARAFAEAVKKHLPQPITVNNRPGALGMIGHGEMINARPGCHHVKGTPADVLAVISDATRNSAEAPVLRDALDRLSMGYSHADAETLRANMRCDNALFRTLVNKLGIKG